MSDLSPDLQAKLRAQAEKMCRYCLFDHVTGKSLSQCEHVEAYTNLTDAFALGQSTERARQQGLRQRLTRLLDASIAEAIEGLKYAQDWKRIERLETLALEAAEEARYEGPCADELEANQ
jgi:hypothetical protein